ncbi:MAG TPA: aminotransferase class I/II-fold pyridoxal phosphate-dependent enzyme [Conexibacter sp.]|nr:aminotransferase class I/II-fold pyridoxal phosphate-dependent enzyme [Conexibacter sp.]
MIPAELELLLAPLERFEGVRRRAARLGDRLIDLSFANPSAGERPGVRAALRETLDDVRALDLQYTPTGGSVLSRRAAADALASSHALPFAVRDVTLTPGATAALQLALRTAGRRGGEVLIPAPCWLDHPLYARAVGLEPRLVPARSDDLSLDLDALRAAASARTCAVLLSVPGNPTGRRCDPRTLSALGAALGEIERTHGTEVTLIADETHRDYEAAPYASACAHHARTLVVYSFGKYHLLQGQRLGYAAVSPRHPRRDDAGRELVRWARIAGVAAPTALMQRALPRLLALRHDLSQLSAARALTVDGLRAVGCEPVTPDATLFVYARVPDGWPGDEAFAAALARRGVLVLPAALFHHAGFVRLAMTEPADRLERALERIGDVAAHPEVLDAVR